MYLTIAYAAKMNAKFSNVSRRVFLWYSTSPFYQPHTHITITHQPEIKNCFSIPKVEGMPLGQLLSSVLVMFLML